MTFGPTIRVYTRCFLVLFRWCFNG